MPPNGSPAVPGVAPGSSSKVSLALEALASPRVEQEAERPGIQPPKSKTGCQKPEMYGHGGCLVSHVQAQLLTWEKNSTLCMAQGTLHTR